eukprot:1486820-Rhodomonas_salina.2
MPPELTAGLQSNDWREQISADSVDLQVRHYRNYQLARGEVKLFYREEEHGFELRMPYASGWQSERQSVWNFGNEIAHR